jgi:RimJ/RimL family protein N-acetyltransferase
MISLVTAWLVLRRWCDDDVAPMGVINADPEVRRWMGGGSVVDEQQTKAAIETFERWWDQHGFGCSPWNCAPLAS